MRTNPKFNKKLNQSKQVLGKLYLVTFICFVFMIFEFIGGWISNSVAIMTDAAHMLSDVAGFFISIMSIHLAMRAPTVSKSYGFLRTEVLGALTSIVFIWGLVVWLVVEATWRVHDIIHHEGFKIQAETMVITGVISLICNIINLIALGHCSWSGVGGDNMLDSVNSVFKPHGGHCSGCSHSGKHKGHKHDHDHDHDHGHDHSSHGHDHSSHGHDHSSHGHDHSSHGHDHSSHGHGHSSHGHDHSSHGNDHSSHGHDHSSHGHDHSSHGHAHGGHGSSEHLNLHASHSESTSTSSHDHHDHSDHHDHAHHDHDLHDLLGDDDEDGTTCYDSSESTAYDNLNLKAAVVHLIGDLL